MVGLIEQVGVCLRAQHYAVFLSDDRPQIPWLEILADNYLGAEGIAWDKLIKITHHYPVVMHCVGLGVGNTGSIDWEYCAQIKTIADQLNPAWISDHFCWTAYQQNHSHSLLPLPLTDDVVTHVSSRMRQLQDYFQRPMLLENIASYLRSPLDTLSEVDALNQTAEQADCGILLDINNLIVNAHNHGGDALVMLKQVNADRVKQYHLAGHQVDQELLIDTHDRIVPNNVWDLYQQALKIIGPQPACVEWDANIPDWPVLAQETAKAQQMMNDCVGAGLCVRPLDDR